MELAVEIEFPRIHFGELLAHERERGRRGYVFSFFSDLMELSCALFPVEHLKLAT